MGIHAFHIKPLESPNVSEHRCISQVILNSEVLAPTPRELGLGTPDAHSAGAAIADEALMAELEIPAERREAASGALASLVAPGWK